MCPHLMASFSHTKYSAFIFKFKLCDFVTYKTNKKTDASCLSMKKILVSFLFQELSLKKSCNIIIVRQHNDLIHMASLIYGG